jgi:hypothetical protein
MMEARHGVMLLGEEFGIHLPRALTSFIASIGPVGAAMEAAFPFLAILVGATLLLEHLSKLKEKGDELTRAQVVFGTTVTDVLNGLNTKLIEAGIKADELNQDHLAALNKQLELIDRQSMNELVQSFGVVSKAADVTFAQLKTSWYQWGVGSAGAKNALEEFKTQYDSLLAQGKDKEANDLLSGTRKSAERVLELQKQAKENQTTVGTSGTHYGDYAKFEQAAIDLKKQGIGYTEKEVESQHILVDALRAQSSVQEKVNELKAAQSSNAVQTTDDKMGGEADKVARERAAAERREVEESQKLWDENYRNAVARLQESEKEKITATDKGSQERLAAIDAAIKEENAKGLQDTGFYKSLLTSRIETTKQMIDEENRLRAEAGKQEADHTLKMGELDIAARKIQSQLKLSAMMNAQKAQLANAIAFANEDAKLKQESLQNDISSLDKSAKDYENKLKALQNKELELTREHENEITQLKAKAEEERNARSISALRKLEDSMASGLTRSLMGQESFSKSMLAVWDQVAAGMIKNALTAIAADDMSKPHDAAKAAREMYKAGLKFPFPAQIVMAPLLAAGAFATVMAFESGGIVPGIGKGDIVPARLEPGEAVLPKRFTEGLQNEAKFGKQQNSMPDVHHHHTYHINAIDGASVKGMLEQHSDTFERHFHGTLRKMNK